MFLPEWVTAGVLQGSSGFRNACVTDSGAVGGKLLAIATPKGLYLVEGQSASDLGNVTTPYHSQISDRYTQYTCCYSSHATAAVVCQLLALYGTQQYGCASRGVCVCLDAKNKAAHVTSMQSMRDASV